MDNIKTTLLRDWLFITCSILLKDAGFINFDGFTKFEKILGSFMASFLMSILLLFAIFYYSIYWASHSLNIPNFFSFVLWGFSYVLLCVGLFFRLITFDYINLILKDYIDCDLLEEEK